MPRSCDFETCTAPGVIVATYNAVRGEKKNKFACSLQHQLNLGREISAQGWQADWRILPNKILPPLPPKPEAV